MIEGKEQRLEVGRLHPLIITRFEPKLSKNKMLVIVPATGVPQYFYFKIAIFFAENGYYSYTFDYSGIGKSGSSKALLKAHKGGLKSWGSIDLFGIINNLKKRHPQATLHLMTHSIGGQIIGFNPNYKAIDKIVLVASQCGYWRSFKGLHQVKLLFFWGFLIPMFSKTLGYFPAKKLGLFENLPGKMALEWSNWGLHKQYFNHDKSEETHFFDQIRAKLLAFSFPKDSYAPTKTVDELVRQFSKCEVTRIHFDEKIKGRYPGHFGFFRKESKKALWIHTLEWLDQ